MYFTTNLRSFLDIIIHGKRKLSSFLPTRRSCFSKWRGNLIQTHRRRIKLWRKRSRTCHLYLLQWWSTCARCLFSQNEQLSFELECWCYSGRCCVETGGASWRFLRQDYRAQRGLEARFSPTQNALHTNFSQLLWKFWHWRISVLHHTSGRPLLHICV